MLLLNLLLAITLQLRAKHGFGRLNLCLTLLLVYLDVSKAWFSDQFRFIVSLSIET